MARRARFSRANSTNHSQYATAVYRSELAARLTDLGYEIERGTHGQPEIRGYTTEYLDASSPRRRQIEERLALLRDALTRSLGEQRLPEIRAEVEARARAGELVQVETRVGGPSRHLTTRDAQAVERDVIERMRGGQDRHRALASPDTIRVVERDHARSSASTARAGCMK